MNDETRMPPGPSVSAPWGQAPWASETFGGAVGALVTLAVVLTLGTLGYAPLGDQLATRGLAAAFVTVCVGGVVYAALSGGAMPAAGPSSATTLIFAGVLAPLAGGASAAGGEAILAVAGTTVVLMGVLQILFGRIGLGRMAQFVPQPVLAGFMNGVAVLILVPQIPTLLGLPSTTRLQDLAWSSGLIQPGALLIGLSTAGCTWAVAWRWPRAPSQLAGLAFGLALYALLLGLAGTPMGPAVGPLPEHWPMPDLGRWLETGDTLAFLWSHKLDIASGAGVLALIGSLESVLSGLAIDQQLDARRDVNRDLMALGAANLAVGLFAGLPVVLLRARALASINAGGRGRRAALMGACSFGLIYLLLGPAMALLPTAVLAGIMVTVALGLADRWTRRLVGQWRSGERSADVWQSLACVAIVCVLTVWQGLAVGVAAGVAVALVVFVLSMNRSLIRARHGGADCASRRIYPAAQEALLQPARGCIEVIELEGALFFGSAERLAREVDAVDAATRFVVLDLRAVSTIDASGAMLLQQLSTALPRRGQRLMVSGLTEHSPRARSLRAFGCFRESPRDDWFADTDRAVEAAELQLLREWGHEPGDAVHSLEASILFRGLTSRQATTVRQHLLQRHLSGGEALFREGDPADGLYVLTRGSITVVAGRAMGHGGQRFASFSAGVMLGETAMLDGGSRSADATADTEAEVYQLTLRGLEAIAAEEPALAAQLYRNMAVHLAERLRQATALRQTRRP